ncbi:hypothetical protein [Massilia pseudoviolaceinigra]|uniref:hypothetical protein n=1 Tax=Massilia pseudoviolaceinigra TaxID=3057165 RepID=UPI0027965505|nr:hypothetical protein [Massilia sp. CCM 9206]MDQ1924683.1 hypothetical protein [Massilia sp. CCM 9206]
MAITGRDIGVELIAALGLPKHTISVTLSVKADELVTVACEYCPDIGPDFITLMARYNLVPAEPKCSGSLMTYSSLPTDDFDAWMRDRTEAAHAAYMAQHSAGGQEYA